MLNKDTIKRWWQLQMNNYEPTKTTMANLNDNEVREVARMQRIIDTLESAIYALCEVANGNEKTVAIRFDCDCEEMDAINEAYEVIYKKLVGREKEK